MKFKTLGNKYYITCQNMMDSISIAQSIGVKTFFASTTQMSYTIIHLAMQIGRGKETSVVRLLKIQKLYVCVRVGALPRRVTAKLSKFIHVMKLTLGICQVFITNSHLYCLLGQRSHVPVVIVQQNMRVFVFISAPIFVFFS